MLCQEIPFMKLPATKAEMSFLYHFLSTVNVSHDDHNLDLPVRFLVHIQGPVSLLEAASIRESQREFSSVFQ